MILFATTSKGLVRVEDKKTDVVYEAKDKKVYGLSWNKDNVFMTNQYPDHSSILEFDRKFKLLGEHHNENMSDLHQIYWFNDRLYIANTRFNRYTIWNGKGFVDWGWAMSGRDYNHINSIWFEQSGFMYCVEHNRHVEPIRRSRVLFYDKALKRVGDFQVGRGIHNVYRQGEFVYVCSSNDWSFVKYSIRLKEVVGETDFSGAGILGTEFWLSRGLAFDGNLFYVGLSHWLPRDRRMEAHYGAIAVVGLDMKIKDFIPMLDMGQIYEVRLTSATDLAHNRYSW